MVDTLTSCLLVLQVELCGRCARVSASPSRTMLDRSPPSLGVNRSCRTKADVSYVLCNDASLKPFCVYFQPHSYSALALSMSPTGPCMLIRLNIAEPEISLQVSYPRRGLVQLL
jgi:hypothetical protein